MLFCRCITGQDAICVAESEQCCRACFGSTLFHVIFYFEACAFFSMPAARAKQPCDWVWLCVYATRIAYVWLQYARRGLGAFLVSRKLQHQLAAELSEQLTPITV